MPNVARLLSVRYPQPEYGYSWLGEVHYSLWLLYAPSYIEFKTRKSPAVISNVVVFKQAANLLNGRRHYTSQVMKMYRRRASSG